MSSTSIGLGLTIAAVMVSSVPGRSGAALAGRWRRAVCLGRPVWHIDGMVNKRTGHAVPGKKPRKSRGWRAALTVALAGLVLAAGAVFAWPSLTGDGPDKVPLSSVLNDITSGKVASAQINDAQNTVTVTLKGGEQQESSTYPFAYSGELTKALLAQHVKTETTPPAAGGKVLSVALSYGPVVLIIVFLMYLINSGKLTGSIGKMSGRRGQAVGSVPTDRFADVAGCDEAVAELTELVEFLKDGERFRALGAELPRGALLVGPPGTGKTLLARAVAGEAGVPFFPVAGSDFVETFVGVGAKRARELFDRARQAGKAIIFVDEIDAIGRARGGPMAHPGETERENTLVSLLNEMDGFNARDVIVLAATNRPDVLDEALTRPGRLDRRIQVPNPDRRGRTAILEVHTKGKPLSSDVDLVSVARQTPGMSGADLAQVVNQACMEAARTGASDISMTSFQAAIATVALGKARTSALVTARDREITAWHEAGHTVAALVQPDADDPVSVTIVPRGPAGGATWMSGNDNVFISRRAALAQLTTSMAGRAAEQILMDGDYTQGAAGDFKAATELAQKMVAEYGMAGLGWASIDPHALQMGGDLAVAANRAVNELLGEALASAAELLRQQRVLLEAVAAALLEEETLTLKDVLRLSEEVRGREAGNFDEVPTAV